MTKYKFKIDYIPDENVRVLVKMIRKGEIIEVVGYSEPIQSVVCYYKGGIQVNIPLQTFLFITEEYHEPIKHKDCLRCKHYKPCMKYQRKNNILNFGDFCARYEEIEEPKKEERNTCKECKTMYQCKLYCETLGIKFSESACCSMFSPKKPKKKTVK